MTTALETHITAFIRSIPRDHVFSSHEVINYLRENHNTAYHTDLGSYKTTAACHGQIGKSVKRIALALGCRDLQNEWSENVHNYYSTAHAYRR